MAAGDNIAFTATGVSPSVDGFAQANGDGRQAFVIGDATNAYAALVDALGRLNINVGGSSGSNPAVSGSLTAAGASTLAGAASTTGSVVVDVSAAGNISFHLLASAFVGTVVFEQSFDPAGAAGTWAAVPVLPEDAASPAVSTLAINTAVAYVRQFTQGMFGPKLFRVRASVFTSGSLAVLASAGPGWVESQPALAPSSANIGRAGPQTSTGSTITNATPAATSSTLLAANAGRVGYKVTNDSNVDILMNEAGTTVTATNYTQRIRATNGYYESSGTNMVYVGAVTMLGVTAGTTTAAAATTGACRVTEFS